MKGKAEVSPPSPTLSALQVKPDMHFHPPLQLLEKQVTRLTEAAAEKEETLERTTLAKVEQLNYGSETRIWEMVQAAMLEHHAHAIHEEDLGPLLQDNFRKALKKLVRLHVVEKYTPRTRVAPRLFRLCRKPLNFARIAGSAAALAVVAAALHLDCAAQAADASDDATDPLAGRRFRHRRHTALPYGGRQPRRGCGC